MDSNVISLHPAVWAIHPLRRDPWSQIKPAKAIRALLPFSAPRLEPVFVSNEGDAEPYQRLVAVEGTDPFAENEAYMENLLDAADLPNVAPPHFIFHRGTSNRKGAGLLIEFAVSRRARFIVLSAPSAEEETSRWSLSFLEAVTQTSPIPVLICNEFALVPSRIERIIFPADFTESSRRTFGELISLAREIHAKILLVHQTRPGHRGEQPLSKEWENFANALGVEAHSYPLSSSLPLVEGVAWFSRKFSGAIIAVPSARRKTFFPLHPSITDSIARMAPCPVLVYSSLTGGEWSIISSGNHSRAGSIHD